MNPIRNHRKKVKKSANIWELEGGKVALPFSNHSNKGEQEIFRDDKGCNWIQKGIKFLFVHKVRLTAYPSRRR